MKKWIRTFSLALAVVLTAVLVPQLAAAETTRNRFVLVAEADGKLVIAPEYVSYTPGQTIRQALLASDHSFGGLEQGWVTVIDGISGNYTRSDEKGGFDLDAQASSIGYFRFSEDSDSRPGENLRLLMTAMASYGEKTPDVQAAAKESYHLASQFFVGVSEEQAQTLAVGLNQAVQAYEDSLAGDTFRVRFGDGNKAYSQVDFPGIGIQVENKYGRVWTDDGDGQLDLPKGEYRFTICRDGLGVKGTVTVDGESSVTAELPKGSWLKTDSFRLSAGYGEEETAGSFSDGAFSMSDWSGRQVTASVRDTIAGAVYVFAEYDQTVLSQRPTLVADYTMAGSGTQLEKKLVFGSYNSGAYNVLAQGSQGNTVVYRLEIQGEEGYTYFQEYTVKLDRVPTLSTLALQDQDGTDLAPSEKFSPDKMAYVYKVLNTVSRVTISATAREGYEIRVNGTPLAENGVVPVSGNTPIRVTVSAGDYTTEYLLEVLPGQGRRLSFLSENSVTVEVTNSNGVVMPYTTHKETATQNRYQYTLVPGETYHYIATKDSFFHITDDFRLEEVADSLINVDFGTTENWLEGLAFGYGQGSAAKGEIAMTQPFSPEQHSYDLVLPDTEFITYVWVEGAQEELEIQANYKALFSTEAWMGKEMTLPLNSGAARGEKLNLFLMYENPVENTLTIRLTKKKGTDGVTLYQDYQVRVTRTLSLRKLEASYDGIQGTLQGENGITGFAPDQTQYTILLPVAAQELKLSLSTYQDNLCYGEETTGYRVIAGGEDVTQSGEYRMALNGTMETQNLQIRVENDKAPQGTTTYTLRVLKSPPVEVEFQNTPEEALLDIREVRSGQRLQPGVEGTYSFSEGYSYQYSFTLYGYVGRSGVLTVTRDGEGNLVIQDGEVSYPVEAAGQGGRASIGWILEKAPANNKLHTGMSAQWPDFRGSLSNNGVTSAAIPYSAESGTLYWANQLGTGIDSDAVGSPILVGGDLITYAGDRIYRVDTVTGAVKATGVMTQKSSFAITPPTYDAGMVFMALSGGIVQAFDAATLESLWIYQDPLGGQPNCPMTVKNGYLYTGFWNSETGDANLVCLSVTDEDPARTDEAKPVSWYHTAKGGYYWAGTCVTDDYVLVGTDDGHASCTSQTSRLLLLDAKTGEVLDSWNNLNGDVRSTVVYDQQTDAYYFTSKGGSFYSVKVSSQGELTDRWVVSLKNGTTAVAMSTCSPVVYQGRAYVGVSGAGQFSPYSGHNITVIDLNSRTIAYRAETEGYPQTSGLLSSAYYQEDGCVYVYFFDNMTPGKLRVLRDRPGQTQADYITMEGNRVTPYVLFTPVGDQAQYAICSPICDSYGTIYFKNDSGNLMAFGSAVSSLEVTRQPDRMTYSVGDIFDPTGMKVTAHLANGLSRDVTDYVTYGQIPLTAEDTTFTIAYPYVEYNNREDGAEMAGGIPTPIPTVTLTLSFGEAVLGDVNGDGAVDETDAGLILDYEAGLRKAELPLKTADVSGDGVVDSNDAVLIAQYAVGTITSFPAAENGEQ